MNEQVIQNRYILKQSLGAGAMGAVYVAFDRLSGEEVALKRLLEARKNTSLLTTYAKLALTNEFQVLASLRHPNIVNVMDYGIDQEGQPYFTMRYLQGARNLRDASVSLSLREKIHLIIQVFEALKYLERRGIIHGDLKPDNILVTPDNVVKVLDFGLATPNHDPNEWEMAGTLAYMAPELFSGESSSFASDIYAVGVMAYEVLTGQRMIKLNSHIAMIAQILDQPFDGVSLVAHIISEHETMVSMTDAPFGSADPLGVQITLNGDETILVDINEDETHLTHPNDDQTPLVKHNEEETLLIHTNPPLTKASNPHFSTVFDSPHPLVNIISGLVNKIPKERSLNPSQIITDLYRAIDEEAPRQSYDNRESFLQAAKFVGREHEFNALSNALDAMLDGHGEMWLIGGESGVGKSRLVNEIRHLALIKGALTLIGEAVDEGAQPFQLWRNVVKRMLLCVNIKDADAVALQFLVPDIARILDRPLTAVEPSTIPDAIAALFAACNEPILLILEDLQWARTENLEMLQRLSVQAGHSQLLIIADYRYDESPLLAEQFPDSHHILLERLDGASIAELTASMIGAAGSEPKLVKMLQKETEGNIFFLIEIVRALAEEAGTLEKIDDTTLRRRGWKGEFHKILQRRVDKVPSADRALLYLAAVAGRDLDAKLLRAFNEHGDFETWLTTTINAAVIEYRDERWRFAHDKLREYVIDTLPPEVQRDLHRRVAETMETLDLPEQNAVMLISHWRGAEQPLKEIHYIRIAGEKATQIGVYNDARTLYERALEIATSTPQHIEFNSALGGLYEYMSQYVDAERHLTHALHLATQADHIEFMPGILDKLAWIHIRHGDMDAAMEKAADVLRLARAAGDEQAVMQGLLLMGVVHNIRGEMQASYDVLIEAQPFVERGGESYVQATYLNSLGAAEEGLGRSEEAIHTLTRASELAGELGNPALMGNIEGNLGRMLYDERQYEAAHEHFITAQIAFQHVKSAYGEALASYYLGYIATHKSEFKTARDYLCHSLELSLTMGAEAILLGALVGVAEYHRKHTNDQRAAELIGLIRSHPAAQRDAAILREADTIFEKLRLRDFDAAFESGARLNLNESAYLEQTTLQALI